MNKTIDQMGREVVHATSLFRIVSLVPSISEFLVDLGLETQLVGVTKFCIHPTDLISKKMVVGGTKKLAIDKIKALEPDFIIANKEENTATDIEALMEFVPVFVSNINSINDAFDFMKTMGVVFEKQDASKQLIDQIKTKFNLLKNKYQGTVCYLIWKSPYFAVGKQTYINSVLTHLGFQNAILEDRYPEVVSDVKARYVFLSSEPFPFEKKHIEELKLFFPDSKIVLVNGEFFSWYGSRMLLASTYFEQLVLE